MFGYSKKKSLTGVQSSAENAEREAEKALRQVEALEKRVEQLSYICRAMWSYIQELKEVSEEDLRARAAEIRAGAEAEDGSAEGKLKPCTQCRRPINRKHARCVYCGAQQPLHSIFDAV